MPLRPPAGFISAFYDPLLNPNAPIPGTPVAGDSSADIPVTPPINTGGSAVTSYTAISTPGSFTGTSATSPVSVTGLTNGSSYTFQVWATNSYGPSAFSAATGSVTPSLQRGIFASAGMQIIYITISTLGNSSSFGNLVAGTYYNPAGVGSTTRGVIGGGGIGLNESDVMQYITFATTGNATSFGSLTVARDYLMGCSNSTRGVFAGGQETSGPPYVTNYQTVMDYITIASTGNATTFGDLTFGRRSGAGCSSPTRGVFGGGYYGAGLTTIDYITIASTGNATSFGALARTNYDLAAFSSSTRGVWAGGSDGSTRKQIQYVTIASTGNTTNFGNLIQGQYQNGGVSSNTRGVSGGGSSLSGNANALSYVTISTLGDSVYFGDLASNDGNVAVMSNCAGGVQ